MKRVITTFLLAMAVAPAAIAAPSAPATPGEIAVTDGSRPYLIAHATGLQVYTCPTGAGWALQRPDAVLTDDKGRLIGTHGAGPNWTSRDGSVVTAARDSGVNVDPSAVDWLRLRITSATPGRLGRTAWIPRIHTVGGRAPAGACEAGATLAVPYTADYVFWR